MSHRDYSEILETEGERIAKTEYEMLSKKRDEIEKRLKTANAELESFVENYFSSL